MLMTRHPDVPLWVQVGDVASNDGTYFTPIAPLYWIKGNNEDFDVVADAVAGHPPAVTLHYLANGSAHQVGPWRVAALGGTEKCCQVPGKSVNRKSIIWTFWDLIAFKTSSVVAQLRNMGRSPVSENNSLDEFAGPSASARSIVRSECLALTAHRQ